MTSFMDELLAEVEEKEAQRKLDLDKVKADQLLMALTKLDEQSDEIDRVADEETAIVETWRKIEQERLEKKRTWLCWNLEQYLKSTGEKTIRLAHGQIKERMGRDRIEITDPEMFESAAATLGLLRTYPARHEPDLRAVLDYIRRTGEVPPWVQYIPGSPRFSYQLVQKGESNNGRKQQTEA